MNILLLYMTMEGQTTKIAERIANEIRSEGHQIAMQRGNQLPVDFKPETYDAAIIGGPIRMGRYPKPIIKFVQQHHDWLNKNPSALFTVCMAINSKKSESRQEAENYGEQLKRETQWHPAQTVTFAGAVKYTQYGFITRYIMKLISKREGGNTDTSQDHEYTDWDAVVRFAKQFTEKLTA